MKMALTGHFDLRNLGTRHLLRLDVRCLLALWALLHFVLVFLKRLEATRLNLREMREQVSMAERRWRAWC
jgi:hypothetical protein